LQPLSFIALAEAKIRLFPTRQHIYVFFKSTLSGLLFLRGGQALSDDIAARIVQGQLALSLAQG
jgi:hypothetical protein